jgi:hypothetical protein
MDVYFVETVVSLRKTFKVIGPLVLIEIWCSCSRCCLARVYEILT